MRSLLFFFEISSLYGESLTLDLGSSGGALSSKLIQLMILMSVISLGPALLIMMTSFTRFLIVFSFLRTALGIQQSPPNMVLVGLSLFLSFFVMEPTFKTVYETALLPLFEEKIQEEDALKRGAIPFHSFMRRNVREKDLKLFSGLSHEPLPQDPSEISFRILIPSFIIGELKRGFEIGFLIFVPFLIIDFLVSCILMSLGMMMIPPTIVALPFKIVFFIMIDGFHRICGSLIQGVH